VHATRPRIRRRRGLSAAGWARAGRIAGWLLAILVGALTLAALARLTGVWEATGGGAERTPVATTPPASDSLLGRRVAPLTPPSDKPDWLRYAASVPAEPQTARVVIVIDDLGLDRRALARVLELPAPLTLAFLPYARGLERQASAARRAGHELLVHLPMAPENARSDPGPMALSAGLDAREFDRRLAWNLARFPGFVGVNNHMGSELTRDRAKMDRVMAALAERGLLFLDSRTTAETVAEHAAAAARIPHAARDVFLDNTQSADAVFERLAELEAEARRAGLAIAIGHPHTETVSALAEWLKGLDRRGLTLVPLSAAVEVPLPSMPAAAGAQ